MQKIGLAKTVLDVRQTGSSYTFEDCRMPGEVKTVIIPEHIAN
jgi:hypothetical protein